MKKIICTIAAIAIACGGSVYATDLSVSLKIGSPIGLIDYNRKIQLDAANDKVSPLIIDSRTMIPLRFVAEAFASVVEWDDETKTATVYKNGNVTKFVVGEWSIYINGEEVPIDSPPVIVEERVMIPLRALAENVFDKALHWDDANKVIIIADKYDEYWYNSEFIDYIIRQIEGEQATPVQPDSEYIPPAHIEPIVVATPTPTPTPAQPVYDEEGFNEVVFDDASYDFTETEQPPIVPPQRPIPTPQPEPVQPPQQTYAQHGDIVDPYKPYTYEQMRQDLTALSSIYDFIQVSTLGYSVEGRELPLVKFGYGSNKIYIEAAAHGREYISASFIMEFIDQASQAYAAGGDYYGYDIAAALTENTFYIIPMLNPDGVTIAQQGPDGSADPDKIKSMRLVETMHGYLSWKSNANGVDFNANYPINWKPSVNKPNSNGTAGKSEGSEPEVQAALTLINSVEFSVFGSFHSQGEVIYWHDTGYQPETERLAEQMVNKMAKQSGFLKIGKSSSAGSGLCSYARGVLQKPAFTIEIAPYYGNIPYPDKDFDKVWEKAKLLPLMLTEQGQ